MQRTLGGDRIGSGNKMKIQLDNYGRSTHDLGYIWRSTMSAGTIVPFMKFLAKPGDTLDINLGCLINTHPTVGPVFGSMKVELHIFSAPIRLYQAKMHNNELGIGLQMATVKLPFIKLQALPVPTNPTDLDNAQINPSCILSYLGIRGVGINATGTTTHRKFNGVPLLAYWDIYKNYYANKQEEIGAVIHTFPPPPTFTITSASVSNAFGAAQPLPQWPVSPGGVIQTIENTVLNFAITGTPNTAQIMIVTQDGQRIPLTEATTVTSNITGALRGEWNSAKYGNLIILGWDYITASEAPGIVPQVQTFPLEEIDDMRSQILANIAAPAFDIGAQNLFPYRLLLDNSGTSMPMMSSQEGLGLKTYLSDLFNNWLNTEWIDGPGGINEITAVDTSSGEFKIDALIFARKVYDMLNNIAAAGGSYDDWLAGAHGHTSYTRCLTPVYHGGLIKELIFQEVVSNANSASPAGTQPLGTLGGQGKFSGKHKGGRITIKVDEPEYIMGLISITPRIDNSQGNDWDIHLENMDQIHKPPLDGIGFQELITEQMAWWDTLATTNTGDIGNWMQKSAGKQPAWINYMTAVNQVRGNFAIESNEMFMTLNRRYEYVTSSGGISDLTTYIDPVKFNHIFAQTSLDAQNFWVQVAVDMTARRKLSARQMPRA